MSGGSYNYFFVRVQDFIIELKTYNDPKRMAFKKLLELVSEACHDIEWVDSGDMSEEAASKAIDKCFGFLGANPDLITKEKTKDL